jgi:Txe/YoeB family toxin of Txe-Axe toxin-antitoxin module
MFLVTFEISGWEDYSYWKTQDRKTLKKIDSIIKNNQRIIQNSVRRNWQTRTAQGQFYRFLVP